MGLSLVSGPATEPVTVAEAKSHMRVSVSEDDTKIGLLIKAARQYCEGQTHNAFVSQVWDYTLPEFPYGAIRIPLRPVLSVSYVHYVNMAGSTVSYADASTSPETPKWTAITDGPRPLIIPNYSLTWPNTRDHGNAVTVRFTAGHDQLVSPAAVPEDIRQAIFLLVAHWYENREESIPVLSGRPVAKIPIGVEALISAYRW